MPIQINSHFFIGKLKLANRLLQARRLLKWYFPELSKSDLTACYQPTIFADLIYLLKLHHI